MPGIEGPSLRQAVDFAITTEQLGARSYRRLARNLEKNNDVAKLFLRLAQDEERHEAEFRALMETVPDRDVERDYPETYGFLRAMSISEFFSPRSGLTRDVDEIQSRSDALRRAIELEKATLGYYQALREVMGGSEALDGIIQAEREHLLSVTRMLEDQRD
jgi:rubrerythrin